MGLRRRKSSDAVGGRFACAENDEHAMDSSPVVMERAIAMPNAKGAATEMAASPNVTDVCDALLHHMREGATAAEAIDTVLLILDDDSSRAMARLGVQKCLEDLEENGQVTFRRRSLARVPRGRAARLLRQHAALTRRAAQTAAARLRRASGRLLRDD
jgi:hypothetical protein